MWNSNSVPRIHDRISKATSLALLAVCLAFALGTAPALAANVQLNATLQPARIALDEAAQLAITVQGAQAGEPSLPQVNGLVFTPMGQSSSIESVNGVTTASVRLTYRVTATAPGRYSIPAIRYQGAGTNPLTLEVSSAGTAAGATSVPSGALPPPSVATGKAFVQLIAPKGKLYVGELMPVEIRAYFRSDLGVNVDGPPNLQSDAFTLSNLSSTPQQSEEQIRGVPYTTLSWSAGLVPIRNGQFPLSLDLPVTLQVHQEASSLQMPDLANLLGAGGFDRSLFDDSTLQSLLGRQVEQSVTLKAPSTTLSVSPLPTEGQPADFSGAVGSFQLDRQPTAVQAAEGDPLTLTFTVEGSGNFDRVNSVGLKTDEAWRAYRPQVTFAPKDGVGREGTKTFVQTVVPTRAGHLQLPAVKFSYFDPATGRYVVRRAQALDFTVTPGPTAPSVPQTSNGMSANAAATPAPQGAQIAPLMLTAGASRASLEPIVQRAWFPALPGVPLAVMAGGLLLMRRRERRQEDPASVRAAVQAQVRDLLAAMEEAMQSGDGSAFIGAARRALQVQLAHAWSIRPDDVTLGELDARLDASWDPVRQVFVLADESAYGDWHPPAPALSRWQTIVHEQLQRVENP